MVLLLLYFFLGTILLWIVTESLRTGISPMPSSAKACQAICSNLPEDFNGKIADLGSGWGGLAVQLAKKFPKSKVKGYELSYIPYLISKMRSRDNLHFFHQNFFHQPLQEFQVIVCYLYPGAMERLKSKLEQELLQGTIVISNTFAIPGWLPLKIIELNDLYHTKIYLYQRPI